MDSDSSDEDFEGFVLSPEEKASYEFWSRKRCSATKVLDSDSDEDTNGDDDDDDDDDNEEEIDDSDDNEEVVGVYVIYSRHCFRQLLLRVPDQV